MKKKILVLVISFFITFSSVDFSFANSNARVLPFALTPQMLGIVATLAVGTGIVINSNDDLYDLGRGMVNYLGINKIKEMNKNMALLGSIALNGLINVPKVVSNPVKKYFDTIFKPTTSSKAELGTKGGLTSVHDPYYNYETGYEKDVYVFGDYDLTFGTWTEYGNMLGIVKYKGTILKEIKFGMPNEYRNIAIRTIGSDIYLTCDYIRPDGTVTPGKIYVDSVAGVGDVGVSMPYVPGTYDWDKLNKPGINEGDVGIYVPGNFGDLVGVPGGTIPGESDNVYVPGGSITVPGVNDPSIGVEGDLTIPGVNVGEKCPECGATAGTHNPGCSLDKPLDPPITGLPPFPSVGDKLDFSPLYATNITQKFPFSLPWDLGRIFEKFDVEPKAPIFELPLVNQKITIDLTIFSEWAGIARFFILIGFCISLIFISTKMKG